LFYAFSDLSFSSCAHSLISLGPNFLFLLEFFGRWPRFSCHAQVSESNSVSSIRFLIKFSASVSSSRAGVGLRFLHQEPASDLRSPHQFGFAGDFFCSCCDFFSLCSLLPAQSEARMSRNPSVSPRFCPLKLFARPCLAAAGLLCLLLRFSFRFAEDSRDPLRF
jgi:hypothetical protein